MSRMIIGCHLSTSKGYANMAKEAVSIDGNTFQFFTRNPRGGRQRKLDEKDIQKMLDTMGEHEFGPIMGHAPYTLNPASDKEHVQEFARLAMKEDLERLSYMPGSLYNFHPGSHVGQGVDKGIELIVTALNEVMSADQDTIMCLEAMSGMGTEIGSEFEELGRIIDMVDHPEKMGITIDTCHIWDGGYDIVDDLDGVLEEIDRYVGLDKLYAIHLNDSKNELGSKKDRHARLGEGHIGWEAIERIINHPSLKNLPFYLETPNDELSGYGEEIAKLREIYKG